MIIECEICGAWTIMDEPPKNKHCPVCGSFGSLFIQENPTDEQTPEKLKETGIQYPTGI
jgi:hypothetical protein